MTSVLPDPGPLRIALTCKCPRCGQGDLYKPGFLNANVNEVCATCGFPLGKNDSADGPAVLMIFVLGALLVPLALLLEFTLAPPLWLHVVLWGIVAVGLTLWALRPLKAYVIALQFKHRPGDMGEG